MAKKLISVPDELVKIIDKAKNDIYICFSGPNANWQNEGVVSAVKRALERKVIFHILVSLDTDPGLNPVLQYLYSEAPAHYRVHHAINIFASSKEPIIFFVVVDGKDLVIGTNIRRRGDCLNGGYLREKFIELATRVCKLDFSGQPL